MDSEETPEDEPNHRLVKQHPARWRPREKPFSRDQVEVGENLDLGDFTDVRTLTVSEAAYVLKAITEKRKQCGITMAYTGGAAQQEKVDQGLKYARTFANYRTKERVEAVERLVGQYAQLAMFEQAQLGSLGCGTAEEAKTLIPSLNSKIDDDALQSLLDQLERLRED